MSDIVGAYWAAPPIARTVATAVFVSSVAAYTGLLPSSWFYFHWLYLVQLPPGLFRLVTSFLLTGPQISVLFDTYFVFTYMSQLESGNSKFTRKEDLVWYLMTVGLMIVILNQIFTGAGSYMQAILIAMCYTATQDARGQNAHFYVITIPAQLMPYCLLLVQLLFPGGWYLIMIGLTGIVAAHMHDFLTRLWPQFGGGPNLLPTPGWVSYIVDTPRLIQRNYGTAINAPSPAQRGQNRGSGPLPDSWRTAGPGRRLG